MIKPLRKRHWQLWSLLAFLLPAGIVAALLLRPHPVTSDLLQPQAAIALPVIIQETEKEGFTVRLRGDTAGQPAQLEWLNTSVLRYPTAVIYKTFPGKNDINGATLIGRIETRGTYHFMLPVDTSGNYHFIVYDFIKQQLVDSFSFFSFRHAQKLKP